MTHKIASDASWSLVAVRGVSFALGLAAVALGAAAAALGADLIGPDLIGPARVIDGDTIAIAEIHVRLFGIDAPEHDQICQDRNNLPYPCGTYATENLRVLIGTGSVSCIPLGHPDPYGRTVAICRTVGGELNASMVRSGWAIDYTKYDRGCRYCSDEAAARAQHLGLWAGTFDAPDQWRMRHLSPRPTPLH